MSPVYNFTSPPLVGSDTKWTAAVYGDMGTSPAAQRIAQQVTSEVQSGNVHLVWHNGDIAYAEGYVSVCRYSGFLLSKQRESYFWKLKLL